MIKQLDELIQKFREIKSFTKNSRKMSKSILKECKYFFVGLTLLVKYN